MKRTLLLAGWRRAASEPGPVRAARLKHALIHGGILQLHFFITSALLAGSPVSDNHAKIGNTAELADTSSPFSVLACLAQPENILAFWPAEKNFDDIINCNTGTPRGGVSFAAGEVGNAFVFNGTDSAIEIG